MTLDTESIAIAHKDYAVAGGGEIVAERLGLAFDAPVYTGYVNDTNRADLRADVRGLWNDGLVNSLLQRRGIGRALLYQYLWQRVETLHDYDVVIQSGNEPLWYVPPDHQVTVAYTHSTPRLMYDLHARQYDPPTSLRGWLGEAIERLLNRQKRDAYQHVTSYPDLYVANSDLVARRIQKYWNIPDDQLRVVYPPVDLDSYQLASEDSHGDPYYLSINRLDQWKRIDELIEAFDTMDATLYVAGKGPEGDTLREQAGENVEFLGYVDEAEKRRLLANADAVLYNPMNEDFGMVPIEALASGTPVIAANDGFQRYQIADGRQGILYDRPDNNPAAAARSIRAAVQRYEADGVALSPGELRESVAYYGVDRFEAEMHEAVEAAVERASIEPKVRDATGRTPGIELNGVTPEDDGGEQPVAEAVADGGQP